MCVGCVQACPAGSSSTSVGVNECDLCQAGKHQPTPGSFGCVDCPPNTYRSQVGATSQAQCMACPSQTPYALAGSVSAQACKPLPCAVGWHYKYASRDVGEWCDEPCPRGSFCIDTQARPCLSGTYADAEGQTACKLCGAGKYSLALGAVNASSCEQCPPGTVGIYTGYAPTACWTCPPGTSNSRTGSSSPADCAPCPANSFAPAQSAECRANDDADGRLSSSGRDADFFAIAGVQSVPSWTLVLTVLAATSAAVMS